METLDSQLIGPLVVSGGLSLAMVWLASRMHMLEPRQTARRCPSCGVRVKPRGHCRCAR